MPSARTTLTTLGLAAVALTLAALGRGQSANAANPSASQSTAPTLKVYSRETIVDVTVTDAKGNPVHGLTRDDFTVKEDNKPQPIRSFNEYGVQSIQPLPKLPPNVYNNLQPQPPTGAVNILLLDFVNSASKTSVTCCGGGAGVGLEDLTLATRAQRLVKQDAMKYIATMPPGTRVAVLGMSKGLRTLQGFTSNPDLLRAAVDTMELNPDGRADTYEQFCAQTEMRNRMTMEALNQIASDTSSIKGRKNLIWFTVGVPALINPGARPKCVPDYESDLLKTYGLFAAAQITLDPIDARGVPPIPSYIPPRAIPGFLQQVGTEELAMEAWAEETGGAAFYNSNDVAASIVKAVDTGADYYTLSYAPPGQKYDWAHHTIKVEVDKPGLHLVYRKTYDAVDPATIKPTPGLTLTTAPPEVHAGNMQAAMSRSMPTSQQILFDVQVEPSTVPPKPDDPPILGTLDPTIKAKLKDKALTRYGFQYAIPARQLTFTPGPNGTHKGAIELDLAAYDAGGKLITGLSQTVSMPLSDARYQEFIQGPFRFTQQLDLPPGQLFLRIGVLDPTSNKVGTLEIPLTVSKK
jgi:VWFA-related protein